MKTFADPLRGHEPTKAERSEAIARLVGRVRRRDYTPPALWAAGLGTVGEALKQLLWVEGFANYVVALDDGPTIDTTPLWGWKQQEINAAECECLFCPWERGSMFTVNQDGKGATGTWFWSVDRTSYDDPSYQAALARMPDYGTAKARGGIGVARTWDEMMWRTPETEAIWDEIAQVIQGFTWYSGPGGEGAPYSVKGPFWSMGLAIDYDGKVRDIHSIPFIPNELLDPGLRDEMIESDLALFIRTLDFLNLRNIEVAPMAGLPRPTSKRLAREGVTISELTVLPTGKYRRHDRDRTPLGEGVPLSSVRGHVIRSGVEGRRHIFGFDGTDGRPLAEGRYWVPGYAKGRKEIGEVVQEFSLEPGQARALGNEEAMP